MSSTEIREPKYRAVADHLTQLLEELGEGAAIPTERELAQHFAVSRVTVRQAVQELLVAGRLRRHGRGTVVAGPKIVQQLVLGSYTEGLHEQGRQPGRRLVHADRLPASAELAAELGIAEADEVIVLERVLLADGHPVGLEDTRMPLARFPRLLAEFDPATSLYAYVRARRGGVRDGHRADRDGAGRPEGSDAAGNQSRRTDAAAEPAVLRPGAAADRAGPLAVPR
jgi:GntR family transcriptional regulator